MSGDDRPFMGPRATNINVPTQCTNWHAYGLTQIWQMLEPENGAISWDQVLAWSRMKGVCEYQAQQLRDAVAKLEAAWPTGRSEAAEAFSHVVSNLAKSLDDNAAAAHRNASTLSDLTVGIARTRQQIADLVAERNRNNANHHITQAQIDDLDQRARDVMKAADQIPARANLEFRVVPPLYDVGSQRIGDTPTPIDPNAQTSATGAQRTSTIQIPPPTHTPPDSLPGVPVLIQVNDGSPVDSSTGAHNDLTLAGKTVDPLTLGGRDIQPLGPQLVPSPTLLPTSMPTSGYPGGVGPAVPPIVGPGGVLRPSQAYSPANPAGAAGQSATTRPTTMPPGTMAPMMPPARGTGVPGASGRGTRRRGMDDAYEQWGVPKGVPGVIRPSEDVDEHDPGPGVIGIDR